MLIWITGLSGAGKTTLAMALKEEYTNAGLCSILLDGDQVRNILGYANKGYSLKERKKLAFLYSKLAHLLVNQGVIVIVATISMFEDVRVWNRKNNISYCEVYLKIDQKIRKNRDHKKLYASKVYMAEFGNGFEEPQNPDFIFNHNDSIETMVKKIQIYYA